MDTNNEYSYLSYGRILQDMKNFRMACGSNSIDFNLCDVPSHKFFKILFYFGDQLVNSNIYGNANGLLHPTWQIFEKTDNSSNESDTNETPQNYYEYNSAWSFLKLNDENERAEKLKKFVNLLSNINSYSPWYFSTISGLDTALERKSFTDNKFDVNEAKKLTIGCIPDAFDNRIGTLLELYRDITYSWVQKKQIIPVNLRKFDMAVYIFESPVENWNENSEIGGKNDDRFIPSYKMIEFHDCEFSYNSIKSGWGGEINNQTGFSPKYNIEITYNDCYEISYNDQLMRYIGDVIKTDTYQAVIKDGINLNNDLESKEQTDSQKQIDELNSRLSKNGFLENAMGQIVGTATKFVKEKFNRAILGNLYTYSLTKIGTQISELAKGNIIKTGQSIKQYIDQENKRKEAENKPKASGNIFPEVKPMKKSNASLGNLFKSNTIANNI